MRKLLVGVALIALVAAGCKVVVTPSAPNGWSFLNEGGNGSGHFVNGPGTPPAGRGSALLTVDGTGREAIATTKYAGIGLSGLSQLSYSTYQAFSGSPNEPLTLAFDVDYDSTDNSTAYQGRLVYVPSVAGTVLPKVWQQWNTMSAAAGWYSSASDASALPAHRRRRDAGEPALQPDDVLHLGDRCSATTPTRGSVRAPERCSSGPAVRSPAASSVRPTTWSSASAVWSSRTTSSPVTATSSSTAPT